MTDSAGSTESPISPGVRPLNRWRAGSLAGITLLLALVAVVALNYLGFHHYLRADLSRSDDYSLSSATRGYLGSAALNERAAPVRWILAFRRTSPFYERVRALAEEYQRLSGGRIVLEVVDPMRSPARTQEIAAAYGITLVRDLVVIDARTDDAPALREGADGMKSLHPHVKLALGEQMAVHESSGAVRRVTAFRGEDVLTAALVEAIEGKPRMMALVADKTSFTDAAPGTARAMLEEKLRFQNIGLAELRIADLQEIPEDLAGLVIAAPRHDFTEREIGVIAKYWNRPRAAILVLADADGLPPNLRAFLRGNGVTVRRDRVVTRRDGAVITSAEGVFTHGLGFLSGLSGQSTSLGGATASIDVREAADDLLARGILPMGLLEVLPGFWGETRFGEGEAAFDQSEDHAAPFHLAAAVMRGKESDDRSAAESSRMIVISNTDFLLPDHPRAENLDFLASASNWLVGRESLAGAGPRPLGTYKLPLFDAQVSFINRVNLIFLPALLLLVGGFVWSARRA